MTERLLPCPFCGGKATPEYDEPGWSNAHAVTCDGCGAIINSSYIESASDRWNRRVPAPQGVSVPYPIRSVLDAALIVYITECREVADADGEMYARQAQQWLDSQRQGQGVSVPMAVRAAINWLDSNSQPLAVKETEWTERWGIVLDWLDACPERDGGSQCQQPQQEGSDE